MGLTHLILFPASRRLPLHSVEPEGSAGRGGGRRRPMGSRRDPPPTADLAARGCALSLGVGDGQAWRGGDGSLQRPRAEMRKPTPSSEEVAAQGPRAELGSREARWLWATEVGSRPGRGRASSQGRRPPLGPALPCPSCLAPLAPLCLPRRPRGCPRFLGLLPAACTSPHLGSECSVACSSKPRAASRGTFKPLCVQV